MNEATGRDLGLLIVGLGFIGAQRAAAATLARGIQLIGVVDQDLALARRVASLHTVKACDDLRKALNFPDVDAVVVATPHAAHVMQVRQSLEAGKHVLCEKPLTIDLDDGRELAALAQASRLRLATGFNHRFLPPVLEALSLVRRGAIGRVEEVRARIGHSASYEFLTSWHADPEVSGGGTLLDNGPHVCDLVRRFLGEVSAVEGYVADRVGLPRGCESDAYARFHGRDGGFAEVWSSWTQENGYLTMEVVGNAGRLRIETAPWRLTGQLIDGSPLTRRYLGSRICHRLARRWFRCECSLIRELESFARPPIDRDHPSAAATGWDGCRATEMVQAAYLSAREGRLVSLEPLPVQLPGRSRSHRGVRLA